MRLTKPLHRLFHLIGNIQDTTLAPLNVWCILPRPLIGPDKCSNHISKSFYLDSDYIQEIFSRPLILARIITIFSMCDIAGDMNDIIQI